jgi:hypothetical protein
LASASIEGVVVAAETGQPLKKANILLQVYDPNNLRTRWTDLPPAITDELGRFVIDRLDEGSYRGTVEREGFATKKYGQESMLTDGKTLKLARGQHVRVDFKLARAGVISGKVLEENGRPARDITVQAYVEHKTTERHGLIPVAVARTNDRGQYRIFGLPPGPYIVGAILRLGAVSGVYEGGSSNGFTNLLQTAGTPFPQLYYPDTLAAETAATVHLDAGETPDIDLKLRQVKSVTVRGMVGIPFEQTPPPAPGPPNDSSIGLGVQAIVPSSFVAVQLVREQDLKLGVPQGTGLGIGRDGSFAIPGVFLSGPYKLIATGSPDPRNLASRRFAAMTRVVVGTTDLNGISLDLKPGVKISGTIAVDPAVRGSVQMKDLQVVLHSVDGVALEEGSDLTMTDDGYYRVRPVSSLRTPVQDNGSFAFDYVLPIEYRLAIEGLPEGVILRTAQFGSANALQRFGVDSGDSRELGVTLGAGIGAAR